MWKKSPPLAAIFFREGEGIFFCTLEIEQKKNTDFKQNPGLARPAFGTGGILPNFLDFEESVRKNTKRNQKSVSNKF